MARVAVVISEEVKAKAEVYYGDEVGQEKTKLLLQEVGLPRGLLPLRDIVECGYVEETGFVWLRQKQKVEHRFDKVGRLASYAPDVTAYVEKCRIRKLTGVKVKELMLWLTLSDITVDDPPTGKMTFKTSTGLYRVFPTAAFELPGNPPPIPRHHPRPQNQLTPTDNLPQQQQQREEPEQKTDG